MPGGVGPADGAGSMTPIERLRAEHDAIERILETQLQVATALEAGREVPEDRLARLVDFARRFSDERHHRKEEKLLFPALERHGVPVEGGPIGVMLHEHALGRRLVETMADALRSGGDEGPARDRFATAARRHEDLLRAHIAKENQVLFVIAERVLRPEVLAALGRDFDAADATPGTARLEEYADLLPGGEAA